jgi:tRNA (guanine-N7-)-methyltransferase
VYFPDPWPKKRHHKRRLVQPAFAALAASRLAPGGVLKLATDWAHYAEQMRAVLDAESLLTGGPVPRPPERPLTRFESRGVKLGHEVFDLVYRRRGDSSLRSE